FYSLGARLAQPPDCPSSSSRGGSACLSVCPFNSLRSASLSFGLSGSGAAVSRFVGISFMLKSPHAHLHCRCSQEESTSRGGASPAAGRVRHYGQCSRSIATARSRKAAAAAPAHSSV